MSEEDHFKPRLTECRPAKGASGVSGSILSFDVVDDDYPDELHFGAVRLDTLDLSVEVGGRPIRVIENGLIGSDAFGRRYAALIVPQMALTASSLTGASLTGRFRKRAHVEFHPREFFADGETVSVSVHALDRYGYELDETYQFTMNEWQPVAWPVFSLWTEAEAGPLHVVPFFWCTKGSASSVSLKLYWGKQCSVGLDTDDAILKARFGDTKGQGKEIGDYGYCSFRLSPEQDWQPLEDGGRCHLGRFSAGEAKDLILQLSLPEQAASSGPVMFTLSVAPVRASLTASRLTGRELSSAATGLLSPVSRREFSFSVFASLFSSSTMDYFASHFIGPPD